MLALAPTLIFFFSLSVSRRFLALALA